nr:protein tyrosine phosphatase [Paenibacillus sambharensis]
MTAEKIFHGKNGLDVKSAGTEEGARIKVTEGHIGWADIIFVMERKHIRRMNQYFSRLVLEGKQIICLDIPDDYTFMDPELVEILSTAVSEYVSLP